MEIKERITLDMLTKDSVSVLRQKFVNLGGEDVQVGVLGQIGGQPNDAVVLLRGLDQGMAEGCRHRVIAPVPAIA